MGLLVATCGSTDRCRNLTNSREAEVYAKQHYRVRHTEASRSVVLACSKSNLRQQRACAQKEQRAPLTQGPGMWGEEGKERDAPSDGNPRDATRYLCVFVADVIDRKSKREICGPRARLRRVQSLCSCDHHHLTLHTGSYDKVHSRIWWCCERHREGRHRCASSALISLSRHMCVQAVS